jgi:vacuolar-type H+-ATPase subunit F/Vma7
MTSGSLYIIGDKYIVDTYRILGCKGLVFEESKLNSIVDYIEANVERIGGILLTDEVYQEDSKLIKKIDNLEIPWIVLPSLDEADNNGYRELERLAEKAIGMKIKI